MDVPKEQLEVAKEQSAVAKEQLPVIKELLKVTKEQAPAAGVQSQLRDPSTPATTTFQEDLTKASQRRVNLIWEFTQAAIALMVVVTTMLSGIYTMIKPTVSVGAGEHLVEMPTTIPTVIGIAFGMVTGFYFSRTNHEKIGGIGVRPQDQREGR